MSGMSEGQLGCANCVDRGFAPLSQRCSFQLYTRYSLFVRIHGLFEYMVRSYLWRIDLRQHINRSDLAIQYAVETWC